MKHSNSDFFSPAFLKENRSFFLTLFALHFPFSEEELIELKDALPLGSGGYSMPTDSGSHIIWSDYGLAFNPHLEWTEKLKKIYYKDSKLLYAGAGQDEWFIVDFNQFPLNPEGEIEFAKSQWLENDFIGFKFDEEGNGLSPMTDLGNYWLNRDYNEVSLDEIKEVIGIFQRNLDMLIPSFIFNNDFFERVKYFLHRTLTESLWLLFLT